MTAHHQTGRRYLLGRPVRVATYASGDDFETVDGQESSLRAFLVTRPGWVLTASYLDVRPRNRTGRIQLRRALADAALGRFDVLLVYDTSRLTRDLRQLSAIIADLDAAGVTLCSSSERFDTATPIGWFTAGLIAAFAAFEATSAEPAAAARARHRVRPSGHRPRRRPRTGRHGGAQTAP